MVFLFQRRILIGPVLFFLVLPCTFIQQVWRRRTAMAAMVILDHHRLTPMFGWCAAHVLRRHFPMNSFNSIVTRGQSLSSRRHLRGVLRLVLLDLHTNSDSTPCSTTHPKTKSSTHLAATPSKMSSTDSTLPCSRTDKRAPGKRTQSWEDATTHHEGSCHAQYTTCSAASARRWVRTSPCA